MARLEIVGKQKKETVSENGRDLLEIYIKYPQIVCQNKRTANRINSFYDTAAKEFHRFSRTKLRGIAKKGISEKQESVKYGAVMNFSDSYAGDQYVSIITDAHIFDGHNKFAERLAHTWDLTDGTTVPVSQFLKTDRHAKNIILAKIIEMIRKNEAGFDFFPDCEKKAERYFSFDRYYLTPFGVAFFYDSQLLFPASGGFPVFVIKHEFLSDIQRRKTPRGGQSTDRTAQILFSDIFKYNYL